MKFSEIHSCLEGLPYISVDRARSLYNHLLKTRPSECLELGFAHGTSSCYIAAALDEIGSGHLTAVDLERAKAWFDPNIEELLQRTGLGDRVKVRREKLSYTWFLKKKIEERTEGSHCKPLYDFCFIDGAHNWSVDGLAFFLVDKLLNANGWLLFDDLNWSYASAAHQSVRKVEECGIFVHQMDEDERSAPQVGLVFDLLVQQHPSYSKFIIDHEDWGWAQNVADPNRTLTIIKPRWHFLRRLLAGARQRLVGRQNRRTK